MERLKINLAKGSAGKEKAEVKPSAVAKPKGEKENVKNNKSDTKESAGRSPPADNWNLDMDLAASPNEDLAKHKFDNDIFSDNKNGKNFMMDDFDFDDDNRKFNDANGMFEGLDDDAGDENDENDENNVANDDNEEEDSDAIDIDNEEELAARGLK
mmetsp:Transcript_38385/g.43986  ORF Transcript_38385/g.43986 Transcript_38385/m.43986 type:complete len:156 (-) Transcript_38385:146-613(-)